LFHPLDQLAQHHLFAYVMGTKSSFVKVQHYLYSTVRPETPAGEGFRVNTVDLRQKDGK
jgi:hypothetical protein